MHPVFRILLRILFSAGMALLICVLFIEKPEKFRMEVLSSKPFEYNRQYYYPDLDGDGKHEKALYYKTGKSRSSLILYDHDGDLWEQYNMEGEIIARSRIFTGDHDFNGTSEIYLFTYSGDSLFLHVIDPFNPSAPFLARHLIKDCRTMNGEANYNIDGSAMEDLDGDGYLEFYFSVNARFTLQPRNIYAYNPERDTLYKSPVSGSGPRYDFRSGDLNGDGTIEIWGESTAYNNFRDTSFPFPDHSAWLMVFSHKLGFEFDPIPFQNFGTIIHTRPLDTENGLKLVTLKTYRGTIDSIRNEMILTDLSGRILLRKSLPGLQSMTTPSLFVHQGQVFVNAAEEGVLVLDDSLRIIRTKTGDHLSGSWCANVPVSGGQHFLYLSGDGKLWLVDPDLRARGSVGLNDPATEAMGVDFFSHAGVENGILLKTRRAEHEISVDLNPSRFHIYLYGASIFVALYLFVYLIQAVQIRHDRRKQEQQNALRTLQLRSLKSQLNPHFIFNALNSISAMYMKGDRERADAFLRNFSRMIREVVDSSERIEVTLEEELGFVEKYLALEQVRYGSHFKYSVEVPPACNSWKIPSMCVFNFVENAVKHAFPDKNADMRIDIGAGYTTDTGFILIRDNGVGISQTGPAAGTGGRGIRMVDDILRAYNRLSHTSFVYSVRDLKKQGEGQSGTEVEIRFGL